MLAGVEIHIPPFLQPYTEKIGRDHVRCGTIMDCLEALVEHYPLLKPKLFDTEARLKQGLNIFLNDARVYPNEFSNDVKAGDKIYIAHVIVGG